MFPPPSEAPGPTDCGETSGSLGGLARAQSCAPYRGAPGRRDLLPATWGHEAPASVGQRRSRLASAVNAGSDAPTSPGPVSHREAPSQLFLPASRLHGGGWGSPTPPGPSRLPCCRPSALPARSPARQASPAPVVSSGPATPCPATGPLPLPDLARSWGLRTGTEAPGVRSESAPRLTALQALLRGSGPVRAGHTEQAWPGRKTLPILLTCRAMTRDQGRRGRCLSRGRVLLTDKEVL